jgi:nucleotide-binding universal stress UspA family protein
MNQSAAKGEETMNSIKTILHPTDFSDPAQNSFQFACALASDLKAHLIVFHVVAPAGAFVDELIDYMSPDHELRAWSRLRDLQQTAQDGFGLEIDIDLSEGDPATEILKTARQRECDLIVMGTHGKSGLRHLLMGNVAERVVRKAPCPVLTARSPVSQVPSATALFGYENRTLMSSY